MRSDNRWYGHAFALSSYVGVPVPPPILAHVQHGWTVRGPGIFGPTVTWDPFPKLVWNKRNLASCQELGLRRAVAVGAPFLYLDISARDLGVEREGRTLVYPFHAWQPDQPTVGSHDRYAAEIRDREEGDVTVCLYWVEYAQAEVRRLYESHGFRVICHGHRDDPMFLVRQIVELRNHARVVTNKVATALWYAGFLGAEIEVYGPPMWLPNEPAPGTREEEQRRRWPELFVGPVAPPGGVELAREELGAEYLRSREELLHLLGWRGWLRYVGRPLTLAFRATSHLLESAGWQNRLPY